MLRYVDPLTGKRKHRSAGTANRKLAERAAAKWEAELQAGKSATGRVYWKEFRERYTREYLQSLAPQSQKRLKQILDVFERFANPLRVAGITADVISRYQADLRERGRAEATIKLHSIAIGSAMRWAARKGLIRSAPVIDMPRRAKGESHMRGRPITLEEFERMLRATRGVIGRRAAKDWRRLLRGLWLSGLRLGEAMALSWDCGGFRADLDGKRPMFIIHAEAEKGHKDRLLPMAPEFAEFIARVPADLRTGYVFDFGKRRYGRGKRPTTKTAGQNICDIGKAAKIKVRHEGGKVKHASAHDLRRSFGQRWAARVMPQVLMELMRHDDIQTTMKFYVGRNANDAADTRWKAHAEARKGNKSVTGAWNQDETENEYESQSNTE
jgi:integrase